MCISTYVTYTVQPNNLSLELEETGQERHLSAIRPNPLKAGFHSWQIQGHNQSRKSTYYLVKIKNQSRKGSHSRSLMELKSSEFSILQILLMM